MSGEYFDNLHIMDADEMLQPEVDVNMIKMIDSLKKLHALKAIEYTSEIRDYIRAFKESLQEKLFDIQPIWRAIENYESGNLGIERVLQLLHEFGDYPSKIDKLNNTLKELDITPEEAIKLLKLIKKQQLQY